MIAIFSPWLLLFFAPHKHPLSTMKQYDLFLEYCRHDFRLSCLVRVQYVFSTPVGNYSSIVPTYASTPVDFADKAVWYLFLSAMARVLDNVSRQFLSFSRNRSSVYLFALHDFLWIILNTVLIASNFFIFL